MEQEAVIKIEPVWLQEVEETPALDPAHELGVMSLTDPLSEEAVEPGVSTGEDPLTEGDFKSEPGPSDPFSEADMPQEPEHELAVLTFPYEAFEVDVETKHEPKVPSIDGPLSGGDLKEEPGPSLLIPDAFSEELVLQDQADVKDEITLEYHDIVSEECKAEESRVKPTHTRETYGLSFNQRGHVEILSHPHAGRRRHQCSICGKCFKKPSILKKHLLTHTGEKTHTCEECGKCFAESSNLKTHLLTHTGVREYECPQCGKCFAHRCSLKKHLLIHTGEKRHGCDVCGKYFIQRCTLNKHLLTHTGERDYKCNECGKCFALRGTLNIHLLTHTGIRKYKCHACDKYFSQSGNLKKHLLIHTRERL